MFPDSYDKNFKELIETKSFPTENEVDDAIFIDYIIAQSNSIHNKKEYLNRFIIIGGISIVCVGLLFLKKFK